MGRLKVENLNQCVSLLREFIDESSEANNKKGIAKLALEQLEKITAGYDPVGNGTTFFYCFEMPRADK